MKGAGTRRRGLLGNSAFLGAMGYIFNPRQKGENEYARAVEAGEEPKKKGMSGAKQYTKPGSRWKFRTALRPFYNALVRANQDTLREKAWVRRAERAEVPYSLDRLKACKKAELAARGRYFQARNLAA